MAQQNVPNKKICIDEETAKKILGDTNYYKSNYSILKQDIDLCNLQLDAKENENILYKKQVESLNQDVKDLTSVSDTYKKEFINKNTELMSCQESKSSRFTWFSVGAITTVIVSLIGFVLIKK